MFVCTSTCNNILSLGSSPLRALHRYPPLHIHSDRLTTLFPSIIGPLAHHPLLSPSGELVSFMITTIPRCFLSLFILPRAPRFRDAPSCLLL